MDAPYHTISNVVCCIKIMTNTTVTRLYKFRQIVLSPKYNLCHGVLLLLSSFNSKLQRIYLSNYLFSNQNAVLQIRVKVAILARLKLSYNELIAKYFATFLELLVSSLQSPTNQFHPLSSLPLSSLQVTIENIYPQLDK